jgi:hypothetical protein
MTNFKSNSNSCLKILKNLVAQVLTDYLTTTDLMPGLQSAYHSGHLTGTAVLKADKYVIFESSKGPTLTSPHVTSYLAGFPYL